MAITETIVAPIWPQIENGTELFDQKSDALAPQLIAIQNQMNTYATQANALATEVNGYQVTASAAAVAAANAQTASEGFRDEAEGFKDSAEAAAIAAQAGAGLPVMTQNGDVLTITDAGTNAVAFQTPSKGGLVPIITVNASGDSAIDFTNLDTYGFSNYKIAMNFSTDTPSSIVTISARLSNDNGVTFDSSSDYDGCYTVKNETSTSVNLVPSSNQTSIYLSATSGSGINCDGDIDIYSNADASVTTQIRGFSIGDGNTTLRSYESFFRKSTAENNNAIRIFPTSGTISGTFTLYGVAEA